MGSKVKVICVTVFEWFECSNGSGIHFDDVAPSSLV